MRSCRTDSVWRVMVTCIGPLATIGCESRQARKGATVAADSGAGMWLVQAATLLFPLHTPTSALCTTLAALLCSFTLQASELDELSGTST